MAFLNPRLDARQALETGLINAVYPAESFEPDVAAVAGRLAEGPTASYAITKALLNQAAGLDRLDYHLDQELENLVRVADGSNFAEGIESFFAKRPARFSGG
jgi:enoyl-CoA hydratase/carnithine racemase